jgi:hypothetical protein
MKVVVVGVAVVVAVAIAVPAVAVTKLMKDDHIRVRFSIRK